MAATHPAQAHRKDGKPLIVAHRGMVTEHQENTMSGIKAALASDICDGFEFDVILTKDKKIVVSHDENLKRLTGVDRNVRDMNWSEIKELTIPKTIEVDGQMMTYPAEEKIPLLTDVLEEIKNNDCFVDLDMKSSFPKWSTRKTGAEVAKIVRDFGVEDKIVSSTIDFFMLYSLEKEHRGIHTGFAYDDDIPLSMKFINWAMERNLVGKFIHSTIAAVEHTLIDENSINKYHKKGMRVGTYTLFPLGKEDVYEHHKDEVKRVVALGVDWIESDNPAMVHELIY